MNRRLLLAAILTVLLLPPQLARAQANFIVHYTDGDAFLDIGTFGDGEEKLVFFRNFSKSCHHFHQRQMEIFFRACLGHRKADEFRFI